MPLENKGSEDRYTQALPLRSESGQGGGMRLRDRIIWLWDRVGDASLLRELFGWIGGLGTIKLLIAAAIGGAGAIFGRAEQLPLSLALVMGLVAMAAALVVVNNVAAFYARRRPAAPSPTLPPDPPAALLPHERPPPPFKLQVSTSEVDRSVAFLRELIDFCDNDLNALMAAGNLTASLASAMGKRGVEAVIEDLRAHAVDCDRAGAWLTLQVERRRADLEILGIDLGDCRIALDGMRGRVQEVIGRLQRAGPNVTAELAGMAAEEPAQQANRLRGELAQATQDTRLQAAELRRQILETNRPV